MMPSTVQGYWYDTAYCPTHGRLEIATIDREHGQHPVLYGKLPDDVVIARAVLACGEAHMVVTVR